MVTPMVQMTEFRSLINVNQQGFCIRTLDPNFILIWNLSYGINFSILVLKLSGIVTSICHLHVISQDTRYGFFLEYKSYVYGPNMLF